MQDYSTNSQKVNKEDIDFLYELVQALEDVINKMNKHYPEKPSAFSRMAKVLVIQVGNKLVDVFKQSYIAYKQGKDTNDKN